jgi:NAD(P)-dependent dehydrogenase (short-subunit alcohol dehydrogenase family)
MSTDAPVLQKLKGKVAIVTGAGSSGPGLGNGKAISLLYAKHGAKVMLVDINQAAVDETAALIAEFNGECSTTVADVTKTADVQRLVDETVKRFGRLDVLVNNVGIVEMGSVVTASEESWDRVFAVNLRSAFLTMKYAIPHMLEGGGGAIVNISSVAGIRNSGIAYCSYNASKAALNQLTKSTALDFARQGIRANNILPGLIDTPMPRKQTMSGYSNSASLDEMLRMRADMSPTGAQGVAWDVANAAVFLASDDASYINAMDLAVDGGIKELIPLPRPAPAAG